MARSSVKYVEKFLTKRKTALRYRQSRSSTMLENCEEFCDIDPDDMEFKDTIKHALQNCS